MDSSKSERKSSEDSDKISSFPLSDYAKLEPRVKRRYLDKISAIRIDLVLVNSMHFEPDCLPPVESADLFFYI